MEIRNFCTKKEKQKEILTENLLPNQGMEGQNQEQFITDICIYKPNQHEPNSEIDFLFNYDINFGTISYFKKTQIHM